MGGATPSIPGAAPLPVGAARGRTLRLASALVLAFGPGAWGEARGAAEREAHEGVIHIVGTVHAPVQLRSTGMSPGHVRAALEALDPDVVCVEANAVWFAEDRYYLTTWESYGVAVPWARERGRPVYGVDWLGRPDGGVADWYGRRFASNVEEGERLLAMEEPTPLDFVYGLESWVEPPADVDLDASYSFHHVNGDSWLPRDPDTGEELDWGALDPEFGTLSSFTHERDRHIAMFIDRVVERHPTARIAVVYGAGHRSRLGWFLRDRGLRVESIDAVFERYPPGDVERFEALLTPRDAAAILVWAFDATSEPGGIGSERAAYVRGRLRGTTDPDLALVDEYLTAREALLRGRDAEAAPVFERLAASGGAHAFPYKGNEWRLYLTVEQAARLELGRIADLQGRREDAVAHYRSLLEGIEIPEERDGYQTGARFRLLARAHTAIRALIRAPYRRVHDLAADPDLTPEQRVRIAQRANNVGEWALALASVEQAEVGGLEPGPRVDAAYVRTSALLRLGRLAEAEAAMETLRELYESTPDGHAVNRALTSGLEAELESLRSAAPEG